MNLKLTTGMTQPLYPEGYWSALEDVPNGLVLINATFGPETALSSGDESATAEGELVYYAYTQAAALRLLEILSFDKYVNWSEVLGTMSTPAEITIPKAEVVLKDKVPVSGYPLGPVELAFIGGLNTRDLPARMNAVENKLIAEGEIPGRYNPGIIYHAG